MSHDEAATEVPESKRRKVDQAHFNMDCLEMIFRYLDYVALVKLSRTCRTWNSVAGYVLQRQRKLVLEDLFVPWKKIYSLSDKHFVVIFKGKSELSELDISVPYDSEKRSSKFLPQGLLKAVMEHCPIITKLYARDVIWDLKPALSFFAGLPHLTHLYLDYSSLTDPILDVILANCNSLVHLDVSGTTCITRESYKMHTANNLTSLKADYCPEFQFGMSDILDSINRLFPKLETLDISGYMEIGEYFEDIFRRGFGYLHGNAMSSLKMLSLKDTEVISKEDEEMDGPVMTRTPNVETLDLNGSTLSFEFLNKLSEYCPKLTSLDMSGCEIRSQLLTSPDENNFDWIISSLKNLEVLRFGNIYDGEDGHKDEGVPRYLRRFDLTFCVQSISTHLKRLKVLEMSDYSDLTNEDVLRLILHLPQLNEFNIQWCLDIDNHLISLLQISSNAARPGLINRTQKLDILVFGTSIVKGVTVPDNIPIKLHFKQKKRTYWVNN